MARIRTTKKPEYDKVTESVQTLLRKIEKKDFVRIRQEMGYSTDSALLRALILKFLKGKIQVEML